MLRRSMKYNWTIVWKSYSVKTKLCYFVWLIGFKVLLEIIPVFTVFSACFLSSLQIIAVQTMYWLITFFSFLFTIYNKCRMVDEKWIIFFVNKLTPSLNNFRNVIFDQSISLIVWQQLSSAAVVKVNYFWHLFGLILCVCLFCKHFLDYIKMLTLPFRMTWVKRIVHAYYMGFFQYNS